MKLDQVRPGKGCEEKSSRSKICHSQSHTAAPSAGTVNGATHYFYEQLSELYMHRAAAAHREMETLASMGAGSEGWYVYLQMVHAVNTEFAGIFADTAKDVAECGAEEPIAELKGRGYQLS